MPCPPMPFCVVCLVRSARTSSGRRRWQAIDYAWRWARTMPTAGVYKYSSRPCVCPSGDAHCTNSKTPASQAMPAFNVVAIGGGNVFFGTPEGPWNNSLRLERKLGDSLRVVAVIDPATERVQSELAKKRADKETKGAYDDTDIYTSLDAYVQSGAHEKEGAKPDAIWVCAPPAFRGRTEPGRNLEQQLLAHFPNTGIFIEKPVSTGQVAQALEVSQALTAAPAPKSVGYMLRYLKVVQKMKSIIEENKLTVMATNARYVMAYEHTAKPAWWDKSKDLGPIIEQATHFCDLSRYFGGDVVLDSIQAIALEHDQAPGKLSKVPVDESIIAPEQRIPRVTSASWAYNSGAVGSLMHAVALQGTEYQTSLDVLADGYSLRLVDPYNDPTLYVRSPASDKDEVYKFENDDPFYSEVSALVDNIQKPGSAVVLSSFEDATKTYQLTWAIREASEKSTAARRAH